MTWTLWVFIARKHLDVKLRQDRGWREVSRWQPLMFNGAGRRAHRHTARFQEHLYRTQCANAALGNRPCCLFQGLLVPAAMAAVRILTAFHQIPQQNNKERKREMRFSFTHRLQPYHTFTNRFTLYYTVQTILLFIVTVYILFRGAVWETADWIHTKNHFYPPSHKASGKLKKYRKFK